MIFHPEFSFWFDAQDEELKDETAANLKVLQEEGPVLGRPRVDGVKADKRYRDHLDELQKEDKKR